MKRLSLLTATTIGLLTACSHSRQTRHSDRLNERDSPQMHDYIELRAETVRRGQKVLDLVTAGDSKGLFARFSDSMAVAVPLESVQATLPVRIGHVRSEGAVIRGRNEKNYLAECETADGAVMWITAMFDSEWRIRGLLVKPSDHSPSPVADSKDVVHLRPPVTSDWIATWGGDNNAHNFHHALVPAQRWAYDLVVWKNGGTYEGTGKENSEYWAWSQPIVAPANGIVVASVDVYDDNPPGLLPASTEAPAGNNVIIETAPSRYVVLAHLQRGSVRVRQGQHVRAGDLIGKCGNSGNSSEPHLHIHVQDKVSVTGHERGFPLSFGSGLITPQGGVISGCEAVEPLQ